MAVTAKLLGQSAPSSTTAATAYSRPASTEAVIRNIVVCNTTAVSAAFRIFHHDSGTTYNAGTALFYDVTIAANTTVQIDCFICMNTASGTIGVRTDTANSLTFSIYGIETT